jgi:peptidyl-prolyl cis-trans isomerase C
MDAAKRCQCNTVTPEQHFAVPAAFLQAGPTGSGQENEGMRADTRSGSASGRLGWIMAGGLGLAMAIGGLTSCGQSERDKPTLANEVRRGADPVIAATVNGKAITVEDVTVEAVMNSKVEPGEKLDPSSDVFYESLQSLINTRVLAQEAEARGLDKAQDVKHRVQAARDTVLAGALLEQLQDTVLDEDAIRKLYRETERTIGKTTLVTASHILTKTREQALAAKARLDRGDPFSVVARDMSIDGETRMEGGVLPPAAPESFPEGLQEAVRNAAIGQIAGPVQSEAGWHLIRITSREQNKPPSLASVRKLYEDNVVWPEVQRMLNKLRSNARIEMFVEERTNTPPAGPLPGLEPPAAATPAPPPAAAPPAAAEPPPPAPAPKPAPKPAPAKPAPVKPAPPTTAPAAPAAPVQAPPATTGERET